MPAKMCDVPVFRLHPPHFIRASTCAESFPAPASWWRVCPGGAGVPPAPAWACGRDAARVPGDREPANHAHQLAGREEIFPNLMLTRDRIRLLTVRWPPGWVSLAGARFDGGVRSRFSIVVIRRQAVSPCRDSTGPRPGGCRFVAWSCFGLVVMSYLKESNSCERN